MSIEFSPRVKAVDAGEIENHFLSEDLAKIKLETQLNLTDIKKENALMQLMKLQSELGDNWKFEDLGHPDTVKLAFFIQLLLENTAFDCGIVDGALGPNTIDGITKFQKLNMGVNSEIIGLGNPGPNTLKKIIEMNSKLSSEFEDNDIQKIRSTKSKVIKEPNLSNIKIIRSTKSKIHKVIPEKNIELLEVNNELLEASTDLPKVHAETSKTSTDLPKVHAETSKTSTDIPKVNEDKTEKNTQLTEENQIKATIKKHKTLVEKTFTNLFPNKMVGDNVEIAGLEFHSSYNSNAPEDEYYLDEEEILYYVSEYDGKNIYFGIDLSRNKLIIQLNGEDDIEIPASELEKRIKEFIQKTDLAKKVNKES